MEMPKPRQVGVRPRRAPLPGPVPTPASLPGRLIGYARVSTADKKKTKQQHGTASQREALFAAGVRQELLYEDVGYSGAKRSRPQFDAMLRELREGDTVVFFKLDRIARSTRHLLELVDDWSKRGIKFRSLTQPEIDTTTASGKLLLRVLAIVSEFERDLAIDRIYAGLEAARGRNRKLGPKYRRPREDEDRIVAMFNAYETYEIEDIMRDFHVSRATVYRIAGRGAGSRTKDERYTKELRGEPSRNLGAFVHQAGDLDVQFPVHRL